MSEQSGQELTTNPPVTASSTESSETLRLGMDETPLADRRSLFEQNIPENYKNELFVKDLMKADDPFEAMFKSYKSAQQMTGQRNGVQLPPDDAPPEAWQAFYKQMGVPEDLGLYKVAPVEYPEAEKGIGDYLNQAHDGEFMQELAKLAQQAGITPRQWNALAQGYDKVFIASYKAEVDKAIQAERENNVNFENMAQTLYGQKAGHVMDVGQKMITQFVPQNMRGMMERLPNEALMILSGVLYGVHNAFMKEDAGFSTNGASAPLSEGEIRKEVRRILASPAYNNPRHEGYDAARQQVKDLYAQIPGWKNT